MRRSGVYAIRSVITGDCYVGSSQDVDKRVHEHFVRLRRGAHNARFQTAWRQYGEAAFTGEILEIVPWLLLEERERHHFNLRRPAYNATTGIWRDRDLESERRRVVQHHRQKKGEASE